MSNIYDVIKEEHDLHRSLMESLLNTEGDTSQRRQIYQTLRAELEAHAAAEEQTFYAELIAKKDGQNEARHSIVEHNTISKHIEELDEIEFSSTGWLNKFHALKHAVEHHLEEEENDIFSRARDVFSVETAQNMVSDFRARKTSEFEKYS